MSSGIEVEGLNNLVNRLKADNLLGAAMRDGLSRVGMLLQTEARRRAPVDRGRLRAGIVFEVAPGELPNEVKIGTGLRGGGNVTYTPYMEYGTGLMNDHPNWPKKRHAPPPDALEGWAARHGMPPGSGAAIAAAIARRGGLKPRRFLRGALEDNQEKVVRLIQGALKRAEKEFHH